MITTRSCKQNTKIKMEKTIIEMINRQKIQRRMRGFSSVPKDEQEKLKQDIDAEYKRLGITKLEEKITCQTKDAEILGEVLEYLEYEIGSSDMNQKSRYPYTSRYNQIYSDALRDVRTDIFPQYQERLFKNKDIEYNVEFQTPFGGYGSLGVIRANIEGIIETDIYRTDMITDFGACDYKAQFNVDHFKKRSLENLELLTNIKFIENK